MRTSALTSLLARCIMWGLSLHAALRRHCMQDLKQEEVKAKLGTFVDYLQCSSFWAAYMTLSAVER